MWTKIMFASLCVCLLPALAVSQAAYLIMDLGPLSPTGINAWDQVVGNYNNQAYLWTFGQMRRLGTLSGGTFSFAAAINDRSVVTGTADGPGTVISPDSSPNQQCSDLTQPFVWKARSGMRGLGTVGIPGLFDYGSNCSYAFYGRAINNSAQIVGDVPVSGNLYANGFLWASATGMTLFGSSWPPTFGNGISNTAEIAGQNSNYSLDDDTLGIGHATVWKSGVATDLGTLSGAADNFGSSANGVNDRGLVVGWSTTGPVSCCGSGSPVHAVLWTSTGEISDLGTLPGDISSAAVKINFFGQVIGSSGNTLYSWNEYADSPFEVIGRPFIWSRSKGMQDLNALIPVGSGWVLNSVADINFLGQIVGSGTHNGESHGFLLIPWAFGED